MSILKTLIDQLTLPKINIDASKNIGQALLVEYAKEQDEVAALLAKSTRRTTVISSASEISKQTQLIRAETRAKAKAAISGPYHPK